MAKVEISIDLPGIEIQKVEEDKRGNVLITVTTTEGSLPCRKCGKALTKRHGNGEARRLRHLPAFGKPCYIIYYPHRYLCKDCDDSPTSTAIPKWHKRNSRYTIDYENHILMELINSTVADVYMKERVTEAEVQGTVDRHIKSTVNWETITYLGVIGIDEIALKKGYKDYITLVTSRHNGVIQLLGVLDGRKKAIIKGFLKSIPKRLKKTVEAICTDMYDGYVNAAKEVFKRKTLIVVDRFHVAKLYRGEVDKYRQKILNRLKHELSAREYKKLKGAIHILRRNNECLTKAEKEILNAFFSHSPELTDAYRLALQLTQLFNTHMSKGEALTKMKEWSKDVKRSKLTCFNKFGKTFKKYKNEISNYFIERNTSAFVEGLNNKAKVLKRRCYGIFNLKHFFQRLHLDVSGYRILLNESVC